MPSARPAPRMDTWVRDANTRPRIRSMRSSPTTRRRAVVAAASSRWTERRQGGRFGRHQVCELPPISVMLVEHRTHRLHCPGCGTRTTASLPAGIGDRRVGPRLRAGDRGPLTARNESPGAGSLSWPGVVRSPAVDGYRGRDLSARERRTGRWCMRRCVDWILTKTRSTSMRPLADRR